MIKPTRLKPYRLQSPCMIFVSRHILLGFYKLVSDVGHVNTNFSHLSGSGIPCRLQLFLLNNCLEIKLWTWINPIRTSCTKILGFPSTPIQMKDILWFNPCSKVYFPTSKHTGLDPKQTFRGGVGRLVWLFLPLCGPLKCRSPELGDGKRRRRGGPHFLPV